MADSKEPRSTYRVVETSFGGGDRDYDGLLQNDQLQPPTEKQAEVQYQGYSTADAPLKAKQPGLMTRIGRGVKAVGGAIGGAINMIVAGPNQDADLDFVETCKKASKILTKLHSKHGEKVFPNKVLQAMMKTSEVLELKDICISVFGQHNCGKSTLLNALIGEELLPVYQMSETSVKIKVQHDSSIHQGVCAPNCPNLHGPHQQSKSCPKLQVMTKSGKKEIKGAEAIYEYLTRLNKKVRESEKADSEPPVVVLKVNIPLLAGRVPPGWTVSLVDNPGFGEAKEHVVQLADASLVTSSAYIYLLQTESIGGIEAADFFKELIGKDKSALRDGRLAVGVTKFDTNFNSKPKTQGHRATTISVGDVRKKMISSIKDATKTVVSDDTIIPLIGEWALSASRLASCLISDPCSEKRERLEEATAALESYPHLSLPRGQEQSPKDVIQNLEPMALITHLEKASGISDLKARIHYVVGNACVKMWATKIISEFQNYLQAGEEGIESRCKYLADAIAEKGNDFNKAQDLYNEVLSSKEMIKCTAPRRKKKTTLIWKEFVKGYRKDLQEYKPQEQGKIKVRDLVKEFKDQCQSKIAAKNFGPADFENSIHEFLNESAPRLQKVFDSSCGFWNVQSVLMQHVEDMVENITKLRSNAKLLCKMGPEEVTGSYRRGTMSEGRALSAPNLADIKLRVKIPSVSLLWWEKVIKFFRSLNSTVTSKSEQKREEESGKDGSDTIDSTSCIPTSPSTSSCNQINESEEEVDESDDSQSDSDEDCSNHDDIFEHLTEVEFDVSTNDAADQDPSSSALESQSITSHCSFAISQTEDDIECGGKQSSSKRITSYRKWTKELDGAINELQQNMEMECNKYFEEIMPKAIKFFYKDYSRKVNDRLAAFDKDFAGPLEQEHRRIKELNSEIDSLQREYYELQAKKIDIRKLAQQLLDAYSVEFASQLNSN